MSSATEDQAKRAERAGARGRGAPQRSSGAKKRDSDGESPQPPRPRTRPAVRQRATGRPASAGDPRPQAAPNAPRLPFALLVLGLLCGALISLLVLRTALAEDAFTITELRGQNAELARKQEALREDVAYAESPQSLAEEARELGMEPGEAPLFIDLETGEVLGDDGDQSTRGLPGTEPQPQAGSVGSGTSGGTGESGQ